MQQESGQKDTFYYSRKLKASETVHLIYEKVKEANYTALLQSSDSYIHKTSEYSIISVLPEMLLTLRASQLTLQQINHKEKLKRHIHIQSLSQLKSILQELLAITFKKDLPDKLSHLPFTGGLIGFISYDFVRYIEKLPEKNIPEYTPDMQFILTKNSIIIDHKDNTLWIIAENKEILNYLINNVNLNFEEKDPSVNIKLSGKRKQSFTEEEFIAQVEKTKDYISRGEIYQANISIRFSQLMELEPFEFYRLLYNINPSPFCAYIHFDDICIICNSPERLIKSNPDRTIETRPIAGTRGRSHITSEDNKLEEELIASAKERSEHIMLVDLERNDLGKVSKYSSVVVDELFTVEKYSHVMHLVSNISAMLDEKNDCLDLIPAMFPGGTITGVPKVRCMEIIEEIEPLRRGLYTGSIGYIDARGSIDLNIVIRTMVLERTSSGNYYALMQFGAGIVADSVGKHEYKECIKKGRAIFDIIDALTGQ
jgi:para-aminobenzoate synthetase component 1